MEGLMPATTTSTDLQRNYKSVVSRVKKLKKPVTVLTNNKPELVVMDYQIYLKKMNNENLKSIEDAKKDLLSLSGSISKKEAEELNKIIDEMNEVVYPEDWK